MSRPSSRRRRLAVITLLLVAAASVASVGVARAASGLRALPLG